MVMGSRTANTMLATKPSGGKHGGHEIIKVMGSRRASRWLGLFEACKGFSQPTRITVKPTYWTRTHQGDMHGGRETITMVWACKDHGSDDLTRDTLEDVSHGPWQGEA